MLSLIIITRNERHDLPGCLDSVAGVADETILVDSGSTDGTQEIARRYNAKIFQRDWPGYGPQKQFALEQAMGDWVLNLDADERLSPELAAEIRNVLATRPPLNGFAMPFEVYFMGRRLRFGGCAREFHVRLFRRNAARYGGAAIHEGITVKKPWGRMHGAVRHESYRNLQEYLEKCNLYTTLIARRKFAEGSRFAFWQNLRLPWEFFIRYVVKLGFLDGQPGLTYALLSSYYAWLKHVKLIDHERGTTD